MKLVLAVAASCIMVFATIFFTLSYVNSDPSTASLDADLDEVRIEIANAEGEAARYAGGAILTLVQVRLEILKTTEAMLTQKRLSLLRRIDLSYTVEGQRHTPDAGTIATIEADLAEAQEERDRNKAEADLYSGGLLQTLALVNAATSEMTITQLRLSLLAEKHGLLFSMGEDQPETPVGQTIVENDGDAL